MDLELDERIRACSNGDHHEGGVYIPGMQSGLRLPRLLRSVFSALYIFRTETEPAVFSEPRQRKDFGADPQRRSAHHIRFFAHPPSLRLVFLSDGLFGIPPGWEHGTAKGKTVGGSEMIKVSFRALDVLATATGSCRARTTNRAMSAKIPKFPGFTAHSDQVFTRPGKPLQDRQVVPRQHEHDPTTVLLHGWGDGLPRHVAKYADGFRNLFPYANQIVVLSPISKAMFSSLDQRTDHMVPVLDLLFPDRHAVHHHADQARILVHTMSSTGIVNYATTFKVPGTWITRRLN
ncbi:hypothetical protein E4U53_005579 [Claviceps sorghi]|nr:hypothetical protein E4U53_005579 [Claviceps sorghi]